MRRGWPSAAGFPSAHWPAHPHHEPDLAEHGWVELDPWAPDTAFARAIDLLRAHVVDAYERAESEYAAPERGS